MYGVIRKKNSEVKKNDEGSKIKRNSESQVKPCPKCGEDFVKTHAYSFNPLSLSNGPKPWTDRKDDNF